MAAHALALRCANALSSRNWFSGPDLVQGRNSCVHRDIQEKAKRIRLGAPLDRETKMGPLVSKEQYDRVRQYQEIGKSEATLAAGGGRAAAQARGYYVEPTIFSDYGLAAAVWSRDIFRAFRVVRALRAGIVWVNHMQPTYVEAPWGGYKQSGYGRELGPWGIEEYLETKQVYINLSEQPIGWY
ncbi:MAG TPA: aldehyde dehydrogenase family protein [Bryobacteraceae bacterium]|nr:aldehyde dehydrogenase family protein [Bryobacteraceae bacterium]